MSPVMDMKNGTLVIKYYLQSFIDPSYIIENRLNQIFVINYRGEWYKMICIKTKTKQSFVNI